MQKSMGWVVMAAVLLGLAAQADAQGRRADRRDRQEIARAQGVPPGQLPPPDLCRVWYDNRSNGAQPAAMSCRDAERLAARTRNARVVYGENVYWGSDDRWRDEGAVRRDGRVRDPRISGGVVDSRSLRATAAYQSGYRDGLTKGREDGDDRDRYDVNRHGWYRSADRGYDDDRDGSKAEYQRRYRDGFEAGYAEAYRVYSRR